MESSAQLRITCRMRYHENRDKSWQARPSCIRRYVITGMIRDAHILQRRRNYTANGRHVLQVQVSRHDQANVRR